MSDVFCPLCEAIRKERSIYEDTLIVIIPTKDLKGHWKRIMVVDCIHRSNPPNWLQHHMEETLERIGQRVFNYTYKFVIMSPIFGTIHDHYNLVATDLEANCRDFNQILATPWLRTVQVNLWGNKVKVAKQ